MIYRVWPGAAQAFLRRTPGERSGLIVMTGFGCATGSGEKAARGGARFSAGFAFIRGAAGAFAFSFFLSCGAAAAAGPTGPGGFLSTRFPGGFDLRESRLSMPGGEIFSASGKAAGFPAGHDYGLRFDIGAGVSAGEAAAGGFGLSGDALSLDPPLESYDPAVRDLFFKREVDKESAYKLEPAGETIRNFRRSSDNYLMMITSLKKTLGEQVKALEKWIEENGGAGK